MAKDPSVLSTRQVASVCQVTHATVCNWVKAGKLRAYRLPGGTYRIPRQQVLEFLHQYRMPVPPDLQPATGKVLVIGSGELAEALKSGIAAAGLDCLVEQTLSAYEAGRRQERDHPGLIIIGPEISAESVNEICRLHGGEKQPPGIVILYDPTSPGVRPGEPAAWAGTVEPLSIPALVEHVRRMMRRTEREN